MTEMIESNKILEATDDEGAIFLLINIKYTVIVSEPVPTHSKYAIFNETCLM